MYRRGLRQHAPPQQMYLLSFEDLYKRKINKEIPYNALQ